MPRHAVKQSAAGQGRVGCVGRYSVLEPRQQSLGPVVFRGLQLVCVTHDSGLEKRTVDSTGTTSIPIASIANGLAGRYATALYDLASDKQKLDLVLDQAKALSSMLEQSADLSSVLVDRTLDIRQATRALLAVLDKEGFDLLIRDFVGVVATNRRLPHLREILAALAAIAAARRGEVVADVVSAHPLNDVQRAQLRGRLAEAGYSKVNIQERVDAALLGGLVVRVGARLYDTSLRSRLTRLHHAMKGAA